MTEEKMREALEHLRNHQQQMDQDGVMVGVSREALDVVLSALSTKQEAGEEGYAPPIGTGKKPHGVVTVEAEEVSRSQTAQALEEAARTVHDTSKRDLEQGYRTRDKEFAVDLLGRSLSLPAPDAGWRYDMQNVPIDGQHFVVLCTRMDEPPIAWKPYVVPAAPLPAPPVGDGSSLA